MMLAGRYRVVKTLGEGGGGRVLAVTDSLRGGARVAMKILPAAIANPARANALHREFSLLATLRHPRLARVHDFGRLPEADGGGLFFTRDLVTGVDLLHAVAAAGCNANVIIRLCADAALMLEVLHSAGMRHGDFKPENVICDADSRTHLIDFGLSMVESASLAAGTTAYLAPEILQPKKGQAVDRRSDLFSLGVTLWQLLSGKTPSDARRTVGQARVSPDIDRVMARLCASAPSDRYPSAGEAAAALRRTCGDLEHVEPVERRVPHHDFAESRARLETLWSSCSAGGGAKRVDLVGQLGSGRSTLVTEFVWRLQLAGTQVVRGLPGGRGAFATMASVLTQLAAITARPSPLVTDDGQTSTRFGVFSECARWLADVARQQPLLIVLDDFDQADPGSHELVRYLAHALADDTRCLLLCVTEPAGATDAGIESVRIPALSAIEVAGWVEAASGRSDSALARRVFGLTAGNLLHTREILETLSVRGFAGSSAADQVPLPRSLAAAAAARLAEVSASDRQFLCALSVRAGSVSLQQARALSDVACIDRLVSTQLLAVQLGETLAPDAGVRAWLLEHMSKAQRQAAHRAWCALLKGQASEPETVAAHLLGARDVAAALTTGFAAAQRVADQGDDALALRWLCQIIELAADRPEHLVAVRLLAGEVARRIGDCATAETTLAPLLVPEAQHARAHLIIGQARAESGDADAAQKAIETARTLATDASVHRSASRELCRLLFKRNQNQQALAVAETALHGRETHSDLVACRAFARGLLQQDAAAEQTLNECARRLQDDDEHVLSATAQNYAAILAYRRGDFSAAKTGYQSALRAAESGGDVVLSGTLRMNIAALMFHVGDYAECFGMLERALAIFRATGAHAPEVWARRNLGHLLLELGLYEQARTTLTPIVKQAAEQKLMQHVVGAHALLAVTNARDGNLATGREELAAACRQFADMGDTRSVIETELDMVEIELCSEGDLDGARQNLARTAARLTDADDAGLARLRTLQCGLELLADGDTADLIAGLRRSADAVREQGGAHLLWTVLAVLAQAECKHGNHHAAGQRTRECAELLKRMTRALSAGHQLSFWQDPRRKNMHVFSGITDHGTPEPWNDRAGTTLTSERVFRLLSIYRRMGGEHDMSRLLRLVMTSAVDLTGAERGFLLLSEDGHLNLAVAHNLPESQSDKGYSQSIAESVFRSGDAIMTDSALSDPRFEQANSVHALRVQSVLCHPVRVQGKIVGVLYLESRLSSGQFAAEDLRLVQAFADQVAVALQNAKLISENRERADKLEQANEQINALLDERTQLLATRTEELSETQRDLERTQKRIGRSTGSYGLVGQSPKMQRVFHLVARLAPTDLPVLIEGESGTGKELVARALHDNSHRKQQPFVAINCGALSETVLESELFGHEKGAFTGADKKREGLFRAADKGTLFLDEIGEMPPRMQVALLRVLQEGSFHAVGSDKDQRVDVRVVAASNRPLHALVEAGEFREDLFYRLDVASIVVPALRERKEDIPLLLGHFMGLSAARTGQKKKKISGSAVRQLSNFGWPGNVRQLENAVTNAQIMADSDVLHADDFAQLWTARTSLSTEAHHQEHERTRILDALERTGWNKSRAAELLDMPRRTFYRRLNEYEVH